MLYVLVTTCCGVFSSQAGSNYTLIMLNYQHNWPSHSDTYQTGYII